MNIQEKKHAALVAFSFPRRDLHLPLVLLKENALADDRVKTGWRISLHQFEINGDDSVPESTLRRLTTDKADLYGFSVYVWNYWQSLEAARRIKEETGAVIVFGGPEASGMAERIIDQYSFVDAVFCGESESSFREYLQNGRFETLPSVVYRGKPASDSLPHASVPRVTLSDLPSPWMNNDYRDFLEASDRPVRAALETSRGCPFHCGYCGWGGDRIRFFDLEQQVKPGLEYLLGHPKVEWIYITDANPLFNRRHGLELLEFLTRHNTRKKPVVFELNPELLDDEYLDWISRLGQDEFALGLQSTSPKVLQSVRRPFEPDRYRHSISRIRSRNPGIRILISLILGLPLDNYLGFRESLNFALLLDPDSLYIHELVVLPGSDFYKRPEEYGIEFQPEPPHKLTRHESFPEEDYNRAKRLSYAIVLASRTGLMKEMLHLHRRVGLNPAPLYERFLGYLDREGFDILGRPVNTASSWFFERYAEEFISDPDRAGRLREHFQLFRYHMERDPYG